MYKGILQAIADSNSIVRVRVEFGNYKRPFDGAIQLLPGDVVELVEDRAGIVISLRFSLECVAKIDLSDLGVYITVTGIELC